MIYDSVEELCAALRALCGNRDKPAPRGCVFIVISDVSAWACVMRALRQICVGEVRLSDLPAPNGAPPAPQAILDRLKAQSGNLTLLPLAALIGVRAYPGRAALLNKLTRLQHKGGRVFAPLLGMAEDFNGVVSGSGGILQLAPQGAPLKFDFRFYSRELSDDSCVPLAAWLTAMESDAPPLRQNVRVKMPLRFIGRGARVFNSAYALLAARFCALEFVADARALDEGDWLKAYAALTRAIPDSVVSARDAFALCAENEPGMARDDPLRQVAWLSRLSELPAGEYLRHVLAACRRYASLEEAAALDILAPLYYGDESAPSPERMSESAWLDIRAERAQMLRALNVDALPKGYWALLERVPPRRRLLYSSLSTSDERAFCRKFLLEEYRLPAASVRARADVARLYPEILAPGEK